MRLALIIGICFFILPIDILAQSELGGTVLSADNKSAIAAANVYLSNSSIGTVTNERGQFIIRNFPDGIYDLVISCIGYETQKISLEKNKLPASLTVLLKPKVNELQEVIVESFEKNGWDKWGQIFLDFFIGTSANASECQLKNKEVLKFRYHKKRNTITVDADEQLVIENNALGYLLKYDLTKFEYNFDEKIFAFEGYPFFAEMKSDNKRKENRWITNRKEAYLGSLTHFMRSLFRNQLVQEGFEVRTLIPVTDDEKDRVLKVYKEIQAQKKIKQVFTTTIAPDSLEYYQKVMDLRGTEPVILHTILTGDKIVNILDSVTCILDLTNHLNIIYKPKQNPQEYIKYVPRDQLFSSISSEIYRVYDQGIRVFANGSYYEGRNLMTSGYWSFWEKICNRLPADYKPDTIVK